MMSEMGARAREGVEEKFNISKQAEKLVEVYKKAQNPLLQYTLS
jgi:hypothetical protein